MCPIRKCRIWQHTALAVLGGTARLGGTAHLGGYWRRVGPPGYKYARGLRSTLLPTSSRTMPIGFIRRTIRRVLNSRNASPPVHTQPVGEPVPGVEPVPADLPSVETPAAETPAAEEPAAGVPAEPRGVRRLFSSGGKN